MPLALIYIRKSVVKANKPTLSPERQLAACREFCEGKGWQTEVYADAEGHRSGRSEKTRPDWLRLKAKLEYGHPGDIAAVVVYQLDRTSRSTRDFLNFLHLLQEKKADFVSVTQQFLDTTSATGRAFMAMISIWAQLEADMDSERVTADIAYRQEQGLFFGHCPIGYSRQTISGQRVPVPNEQAPLVVRIWEEYATSKYSYRGLARWINADLHLPTQGGAPWTHKHVQILFDNHAFYTGWVTRHRKRGGTLKFKGRHEGIVSQELADKVLQVRAAKEARQLRYGRPAKQVYLLTPLLHCSGCGQQLRAKISHGERGYQHYGKSPCTWSYVDAAAIEGQVLKRFRGWELPADVEARMEEEAQAQPPKSAGDAAQMKRLEQRKEKALRLYELGMRDEAWLVATVAEIEASIRAVSPPTERPYQVSQVVEMLRTYMALVSDQGVPAATLRPILSELVERIETNGEAVTMLRPRRWYAAFLNDVSRVNVYPQGTSGTHIDAWKDGLAAWLALAK